MANDSVFDKRFKESIRKDVLIGPHPSPSKPCRLRINQPPGPVKNSSILLLTQSSILFGPRDPQPKDTGTELVGIPLIGDFPQALTAFTFESKNDSNSGVEALNGKLNTAELF